MDQCGQVQVFPWNHNERNSCRYRTRPFGLHSTPSGTYAVDLCLCIPCTHRTTDRTCTGTSFRTLLFERSEAAKLLHCGRQHTLTRMPEVSQKGVSVHPSPICAPNTGLEPVASALTARSPCQSGPFGRCLSRGTTPHRLLLSVSDSTSKPILSHYRTTEVSVSRLLVSEPPVATISPATVMLRTLLRLNASWVAVGSLCLALLKA